MGNIAGRAFADAEAFPGLHVVDVREVLVGAYGHVLARYRRELDVGDLLLAVRDCLEDFERVCVEDAQRTIEEAYGDELAVRGVLTGAAGGVEELALDEAALVGLYVPDAQGVVVAEGAAFEALGVGGEAPELALAVALDYDADGAVLVDVNDLAVLGAD